MGGDAATIIAFDAATSASPPSVADVGGKASSLFNLIAQGFRVPPFFVLTAQAYRSSASKKVSASLRTAVSRAWQALGGDAHAYAVRSSGLAEDSADFSFAGVFETVLDVRGEDALIAAIEHCWASHRSAIAGAYREKRGVIDDAALAVIVQRMVRAEWAGVSFSADPLRQALSICTINASPGLGDRLVSGLVNPEEIRIDVRTGEVLERRTPPGVPCFPDELREEVFRQTLRAAAHFGFPQDLEWAVEKGTLFLLQSRPITTLAGVFHNRAMEPWAGKGRPDAPERVWTRAYADEVWAPPLSPLFYDVQNLTVVTAQQLANAGDSKPVPPDVFKYFRAAAYMDSGVLERLYATLPPIARRDSLLALLAPERREAVKRAPWNWRGTLGRLWRFEVKQGRTRGILRNHRVLERAWPRFLRTARQLCDVDPAGLTEERLESHLGDVWRLALSVAPECEVAVLYYAHDLRLLLSGLLDRWCGNGEQLYAAVSAGLSDSETVRETDAIWAIADTIRRAGADAVSAARTLSWTAFRAQADALNVAAVPEQFDRFLRLHRHRGASYKDLIYPRWGDDPELLWLHIRAFLLGDTPRPSEANAKSGERRIEAQRAALAAVKGPWAFVKRAILRVLFRGNEIYSGLRDNHRFYYDHVWWLVRRVYLETGRRLHAAKLLSDATDVMFLVRSEIDELKSGQLPPTLAAARIAIRRREWDETRERSPPRYLRRGYLPDNGDAPAEGSRTLVGLGASPGQVRARARIARDVTELARIADGEILVARQTDPGWTPAFARLAGLVLETGGVLAHGASLCREYGLPCVTAVDDATSRIRDGDWIYLDGSNGTVSIL